MIDRDELQEARGIQALEARLGERFAGHVGTAEIRREVRAAYREFESAPIRTYVLILVERTAHRRLAACGGATAAATRREIAGAGA